MGCTRVDFRDVGLGFKTFSALPVLYCTKTDAAAVSLVEAATVTVILATLLFYIPPRSLAIDPHK
jgi:hypothetical protein